MKINMTTTNGVILKTKNKICKEDIIVGLSDKEKAFMIPSNIRKGVTLLGVVGTMESTGSAFIFVDEEGSLNIESENVSVDEDGTLNLG